MAEPAPVTVSLAAPVASTAATSERGEPSSAADSGSGAASSVMPSLERLVIRDAQLQLVHKDPRALSEHATQIVRAAGGFVLDGNMEASGSVVHQAVMQLRVPEPVFESTLKALRALGTMQQETVTGQDVTEEFVDTEARLRALRTLEARMIALLERSGPLTDLLQVEQELSRVRGDIERNQGRVRYLQERTQMASIRLTVQTAQAPALIERASIAQRFERAFAEGTAAGVRVVQIVIALVGFALPAGAAAAVLAGPFFFFLRARKNRRALPAVA